MRPKTLIDCLAAVDRQEADALIAIEPEARYAMEKLKLTQSFQLAQRFGETAALRVAVAKDHPRQAQTVQTINDALAKLRASGGYAELMAAHLSDLTGTEAKQR